MRMFLMGKQRSGKDTIAEYLYRYEGFQPYALAEGVYEIARKYFGMQNKDRALLIAIGEKMREIDPLVWVKYTLSKIDPALDRVVITDVRMKHEYEYLVSHGWHPIGVEATKETRMRRAGYTHAHENDPTEPDLSKYTFLYTLENNGTIEELYDNIDTMLEYFEDLGLLESLWDYEEEDF